MGMEKLVLIVFAMIFVQGLFTFVQVKNYNKRIQAMKRFGMVGIGMKKGRLVPGSIILLAVDKSGTVVRCERMKGFSVFARFREVKELAGSNIAELKARSLANRKYTRKGIPKPDPLLQAIEGLEARLAS
jgi:glucitol operon activator protein